MDTKVDGRRARGLRTHEAIVGALMALVDAGDVNATAQRVADRAGVSVRSLYQHFTDVDELFGTVGARLTRWAEEQSAAIDPSQPLETRLGDFTQQRSMVLERLLPFHRAARVLAQSSDTLRAWRASMVRQATRHLEQTFEPELSRLPRADRDRRLAALDLLNTWQSWDLLRQAGRDQASARAVIADALAVLLQSPPVAPRRGHQAR